MALVTLSALRERIRERADMQNSRFVTDSELRNYINASAPELYDLLVKAFHDYATTSAEISVTGSSLSLPSGFYLFRGLDKDVEGSWLPVRPYEFLERGQYQDEVYTRYDPDVKYRLIGNAVDLLPAAVAPGSYRLWYVPEFTALSADSDTFDGLNGWEEWIVVDCAIKCKDKEESSTTGLEKDRQRLTDRIEAMIAMRDKSGPSRISDVRPEAWN